MSIMVGYGFVQEIGKPSDINCERVSAFFMVEKEQGSTFVLFVKRHPDGADGEVADERLAI
jgi:hypothetical protein